MKDLNKQIYFDKIFKSQVELINNLKKSQLRRVILLDIEFNSSNISNTISFSRTTRPGCITTSLHQQHLQVITSMNAYEYNAYDFCLHTSEGMKLHPPRATYDAMYRYGWTIGHDITSNANGSCNAHDMLQLIRYFKCFTSSKVCITT
jgi:hypothetical protein